MVLNEDLRDMCPLFDLTVSLFVLQKVRLQRGICLEKKSCFRFENMIQLSWKENGVCNISLSLNSQSFKLNIFALTSDGIWPNTYFTHSVCEILDICFFLMSFNGIAVVMLTELKHFSYTTIQIHNQQSFLDDQKGPLRTVFLGNRNRNPCKNCLIRNPESGDTDDFLNYNVIML